jgi:CDP-L-myo-inositol myo-inositolphosphotransferase
MDKTARAKPSDGFISRHLNRKISTRITNYILRHDIGITPTQVTLITTAIGYLTLPLYILGMSIIGGTIAQITSILDGVDGELARARSLTSKRGAFLDAILDRTVDISILIGTIYYSYTYQHIRGTIPLIIYLLAVSGWLMVSYTHSRIERYRDIGGRDRSIPRFASRDIRIFIIFIGSLIDQTYQALALTALITYIYIVIKIWDEGKTLQQ